MRQRDEEGERRHKEENEADCKIRWKVEDEKVSRKKDPRGGTDPFVWVDLRNEEPTKDDEGEECSDKTSALDSTQRYSGQDARSSPQDEDNLPPLEKKLLSHSAHTSDLSSDPTPWSGSETEGENDSEENNSVEDRLLPNITPTSGNKTPIKEVEKSEDDDDTASNHSEGRSSSCSFLDSSDSNTTIDSSPMSEKELSGQSSYGSSHCSPSMVSPSSMSGMSLRDSSMETSLSTIPGSFGDVAPRRTKRRDADDDDIEEEEQDFSP
ncbi:hypothetical protein Pcinc_041349 [Petrolisthes cinctipes]|uniref:Uncharacterized protein n=1 Tax=Petrolisthes cinctipes TaxID=88211 RepID=A0AAE1BKC6_PETCI|nr:hypothetical protein Pcinc_041349 [Petrolisthes cinctipes]